MAAGNRDSRSRYLLSFGLLLALFVLLFLWNLNSGTVQLTPGEIAKILFTEGGDRTARPIVWEIRLPRILAAAVLGGALAVSGFLLQTFFANPIASPFVLGISSGAKLTVALAMIVLLERGLTISSAGMVLAAFAGSMISMGFVLLISGRVRQMSMLVVCGVMIGYICSAITDFLVTFAEDSDIVSLHNWSLGSFSGTSWEQVKLSAAIVFACLMLTLFMAKPMGAYRLGEVYAQNMGVNLPRFRAALILVSSVLSACVTAFAGPVSFVGIAVPHLAKRLFGTSSPLVLIPGCFLGGSVFCLFCDRIARTAFSPAELSISSVTAVFGAPVVILIMAGRRKQAA